MGSVTVTVYNKSDIPFPKTFELDSCKCELQKYVRNILKSDFYNKVEITRDLP